MQINSVQYAYKYMYEHIQSYKTCIIKTKIKQKTAFYQPESLVVYMSDDQNQETQHEDLSSSLLPSVKNTPRQHAPPILYITQ